MKRAIRNRCWSSRSTSRIAYASKTQSVSNLEADAADTVDLASILLVVLLVSREETFDRLSIL